MTATLSTIVPHRLQLLQLVGRQDGSELRLRVLHDRLGLFAALVLRQVGICMQGLHLLLAVAEDRLQLGGLVSREIELLAEVLCSLVRVELVMTAELAFVLLLRLRAVLGLGGRRGSLLSERGRSGQRKGEGRVNQYAFHSALTPCAAFMLPVFLHE